MNNVVLTYNPYQCKNIILVDEQAFSPYSTVSNYLLAPFEFWCEKIGRSIADELNDNFSLTFVSDRTEAIILESYIRNNCPECERFICNDFENPIPVPVRCQLLSEALCQKGIDTANNREVKLFFDNLSLMSIFENEAKNLVGLSACDGEDIFVEKYSSICSLKIKLTQECSSAKGSGIYVFENERNAEEFLKADCSSEPKIIIMISEGFKTVSVSTEHIVLKMTTDDLINNFFGLIELLVIKPLIFSFAEKLKISDPAVYEAVTTVDSIVLVDFDDTIECGNSISVRVRTVPETHVVPELRIKSLNEKVLRVSGSMLVGVDSGEAVVEVYEVGNIIPIARKTVTVIRKNRINKIEFDCDSYTLEAGEATVLNATVYPANADNLHTLEWSSSDTNVATVSKDGTVKAVSPGVCCIILKAENVSEKTEIVVKAKVAELVISSKYGSDIISTIGQSIPYEVVAVPEDSYDPTVEWKIFQDNGVIKYDGHNIRTEHLGNATIEFSSADGLVKRKTNIQVVSTLYKKTNPLKFVAIILAALTFCLCFAEPYYGVAAGIIAAVVSFASVYVSKKNSDYEQSIVGYNKKSSYVSDIVLCVVTIALLIFSVSAII